MMILAIIFLSFFGYCIFFVQKFSLKIEELPVLTVSTMVFLLYLFSLLNLLVIGVYIILIIGILLAIATLISRFRQIPEVFKAVFTPGMCIFMIGIPIIYILARHIIFFYWDEFSHWGLIDKVLYTTGSLPGKDNLLSYPTYPPGTALFQYYFIKLLGYREGIIVFAQVLMVWSAAIPFTKGLKWKQIPLAVLALCVPFVAYIHFSNTLWCIYVDGILGLLFASAFAIYYNHDEHSPNDIIKIVPILVFMTLIKESGIFIALLVCALIIIDQMHLIKSEYRMNKISEIYQKNRAIFLFFMIIIATPILISISWAFHLKFVGIISKSLFSNFSSIGAQKFLNVSKAFMKAWISIPIGITTTRYKTFSTGIILTLFMVIVSTILIIIIKDKAKRKRAVLLISIVFCQVFLFSIGLIFTYTIKFTDYEATNLASFGRYLSTIFSPLVLCIFYIILNQIRDITIKPKVKLIPILLSCILFATFYTLTPSWFTKIIIRTTYNSDRTNISLAASHIKNISDSSDKIYIIWENTSGRNYLISKYELYPLYASRTAWSIGTPYGAQDIWTKNISLHDWESTLRSYKFVYIGAADDQFKKIYGSLFRDSDVRNNSIYEVEYTSTGNMMLVLV